MDSKFVCLTASKDISRMDDTLSFEKIFVFMLKDGYMPMYACTVILIKAKQRKYGRFSILDIFPLEKVELEYYTYLSKKNDYNINF